MRALLALAAACLLAVPARTAAQQAKPLFAASEPIHIAIQAPLSMLMHKRSKGAVVQGTLTDPLGRALPITLNPRGITRLESDVCDFPPLKVRFTSPPPAASLFAGQNSLKLVTHCRNKPEFQQYVLLEYSAYRMYNLLTPHSFRVRLASIDYRDESGRPIISRAGYFLEDLKDVARRNGLKQTRAPERIPIADLNPADGARYALFQHMLANHDWSMQAGPAGEPCCHNAELIGPLAAGAIVPIPYDFDFSGFVNAPYATPPDALQIGSVRERLFRGYCAHRLQIVEVARQMRELRPQMMAAISSTPGIEQRTATRAIAFLAPFFDEIASDDAVNGRLLRRCSN